jgi:hypothetical protein
LYEQWGYDSFQGYIQLELKLRKAKAQNLIALCEGLDKLKITQDDIKELGLSKTWQIVNVSSKVDNHQLQVLKEQAKAEPVEVVEQKIRKIKNTVPATTDKSLEKTISDLLQGNENFVRYSALLYESVYDLFISVLNSIKTQLKIDSENKAIEYLCMHFSSSTIKAGSQNELRMLLKHIESVFGIKITAKRGGDVVYP